MSYDQALAFSLVGVTIALFVWGRFRYDLVALAALGAGLALGVVPAAEAFAGFSSDITVIIASALVVSAAVSRSGAIERLLRPLLPRLKSEAAQVIVLATAATLLSMVTKNVGALAILMPIAIQLSRRTGTPTSRLLMPMAFGSLLGGLVTLVGTSPNIIVSQVREQILGKPFGMYDFAPVGLGLTAAGLAFLAFAYRLLPSDRHPVVGLSTALASSAYLIETSVPEDWAAPADRVGDLHRQAEGEVRVAAILRSGRRISSPHANTKVRPGDTLMLEGEQQALDDLILKARLKLARSDRPVATEARSEEVQMIEAVVRPGSGLVGQSAQRLDLHGQHRINLLGVSRAGYRPTQKLRSLRLQAGDVVMLQGGERTLPGVLQTLGLLPLAERELRLGGFRRMIAPSAILATAMVLVAFRVAPVAVAFFGAALAMVLIGALRMREAYQALDGPLIVLVAALIPVSEAVQSTGGADLIGGWLSAVFRGQSPLLALAGIMAVSMAATPFLNNAATVLIVAPVGVSLARGLGLSPDPFLMAVAVGAACDFLTPVGHQCNTMVMMPGGYRFSDYPRLGAPLSLLVLTLGVALIALVWPLRSA
ncbi:MAG: SLC13 family permease [Phenylobacterium sp.]|uniref:SLC13 family permease n=1 Tax=Phenylobacterium sp. TaxID=1871053 RepID=UPI00391C3F51